MSRCAVETTHGTFADELEDTLNPNSSLTTPNRPTKHQGDAVEEELNEEDGSIRLVVRKWVSE